MRSTRPGVQRLRTRCRAALLLGLTLACVAIAPQSASGQTRPPRTTPATTPSTTQVQLLAKPFDQLDLQASGFSDVNAYILSLVSHYIYPHAYHPRAEAWDASFKPQFIKMMKDWGMDKVEPRQGGAFTLLSHGDAHIQYAIMSNDKVVILVFRGSDHIKGKQFMEDWVLTNANAQLTEEKGWGSVAYGNDRKMPRVHPGFRGAYWNVREDINKKLAEHGAATKPLFITGHSLGAALAVMCAIDQVNGLGLPPHQRFKARGVYTYGGPRVGDGVFAKRYSETLSAAGKRSINTHRFLRCGDAAGLAPPILWNMDKTRTWSHVGTTHLIDKEGRIAVPTAGTFEQAYFTAGCGGAITEGGVEAALANLFGGDEKIIESALAGHDSKLYTCDLFDAYVASDAGLRRRVPPVPEHVKSVACP